MKKTFGKLIGLMLMTAMLLQLLSGCTNPPGNTTTAAPTTQGELPDAPADCMTRDGEDLLLLASQYRLRISSAGAVTIENSGSGKVLFRQRKPATVKVRGKGQGIGVETYKETTYSVAYTDVTAQKWGYRATADVKTEKGSLFRVTDDYYLTANGVFAMARDVQVIEANAADVGFASIVSLVNGSASNYYDDFDYFIPSILYKNGEQVVSGAIASNLDLDRVWVKETRTGLPIDRKSVV